MSWNICRLKNISGEVLNICRTWAIDDEYTIPDHLRQNYSTDSLILEAIANSNLQVGSSTEYIEDLSQQIDWLKNIDAKPKDSDNAEIIQPKTTKLGWHYQPLLFCVTTCKANSVFSKKCTGEENTGFTLKFYNSSQEELVQGQEESDEDYQTRLNSNCIYTVLDWQADYTYDIIGASLYLKSAPTNPAWAWCKIAPDIAEEYGGSIPYLDGGLDLSFMPVKQEIFFDGRGTKTIPVDLTYNSNKFRFPILHSAGEQIEIQFIIHHFKE